MGCCKSNKVDGGDRGSFAASDPPARTLETETGSRTKAKDAASRDDETKAEHGCCCGSKAKP